MEFYLSAERGVGIGQLSGGVMFKGAQTLVMGKMAENVGKDDELWCL